MSAWCLKQPEIRRDRRSSFGSGDVCERRSSFLPYAAIHQAFYSRSKQPKWKDDSGKEQVGNVDLGKMSFFRGDRHWLIFLTQSNPMFLQLDGSNLQSVLSAFQQRTGIAVRR